MFFLAVGPLRILLYEQSRSLSCSSVVPLSCNPVVYPIVLLSHEPIVLSHSPTVQLSCDPVVYPIVLLSHGLSHCLSCWQWDCFRFCYMSGPIVCPVVPLSHSVSCCPVVPQFIPKFFGLQPCGLSLGPVVHPMAP